jgi:hypothetical protein
LHASARTGPLPAGLPTPLLAARAAPSPSSAPQVGWKHQGAVAELEAKRKAKALKFYEAKKKAVALRAKAAASV